MAPALYGQGQSILGGQSSYPARQILRTTVDGRPGHLKRQWGKERKNILSETRARGNTETEVKICMNVKARERTEERRREGNPQKIESAARSRPKRTPALYQTLTQQIME